MLKELNPGVQENIKLAKLQLLKGIWTSKFDYTRSSEEYIEAFHMLNDILGTEDNYFSANCQLEIGSNHLRQKEASTATAFFYKGQQVLEKKFGPDHSLMQKYYGFCSEVASQVDDNEMML